jgi:RNA polymerase sigma-70 factor (ECF subfamily)
MFAPERFPTTRVSLVLAAASEGSQARDAFADLCRIYWRPLYAFIRRRGSNPDEAQDLTQGFLAHLLEAHALRAFRQERGRFRNFLLATLRNFLANQHNAAQAQKRGGGIRLLPLDFAADAEQSFSVEPRDNRTPEKIFERQWALTVVNQATARLRGEYEHSGKGELFRHLHPYLTGDDDTRYRAVAAAIGISENSVKVAVHRLRQRFHEALREEIAATVFEPEEVSDEIRYLMAALRA